MWSCFSCNSPLVFWGWCWRRRWPRGAISCTRSPPSPNTPNYTHLSPPARRFSTSRSDTGSRPDRVFRPDRWFSPGRMAGPATACRACVSWNLLRFCPGKKRRFPAALILGRNCCCFGLYSPFCRGLLDRVETGGPVGRKLTKSRNKQPTHLWSLNHW